MLLLKVQTDFKGFLVFFSYHGITNSRQLVVRKIESTGLIEVEREKRHNFFFHFQSQQNWNWSRKDYFLAPQMCVCIAMHFVPHWAPHCSDHMFPPHTFVRPIRPGPAQGRIVPHAIFHVCL